MFLLKFVAAHWVVFSLIYVVLMGRTAVRLISILHSCRWYQDIRWYRVEGKLPFWYLPPIICFSVGYLFALPLFILFRWADHSGKKMREQAKIHEDRQRAEWERVERENTRRAKARKQWITENGPTLYCNTMSGVTAVLRPADYSAARKQTERSRRNGFWEKDNVLLPFQDTIIFVTKQGREMIDANTGSDYIGRYKVAGWISQLYDIIEEGGAKLVEAKDIFVPWVNETIVPFERQTETLRDCVLTGSYYHLIETQAPAELQPLLR